MTNFERIKAMSLDEMAEQIAANSCHNCVYVFSEEPCRGRCTEGTRKWLESEAEDNGTV